jgi:indolepyruvate ferredoxin oxidoreductase alpha subunit
MVTLPAVGRRLRLELLERRLRLLAESESSSFNFVSGKGDLGLITSGASWLHVLDAVKAMGLEDRTQILKLGFTYPPPRTVIGEFLRGLDKALVVEEVEPFLEEAAKVIAQESKLSVEIGGKGEGLVPQAFELDPMKVKSAIGKFFGIAFESRGVLKAPELPQRPPNLCPGCPHRATYYSVKQVFGEEAIYPTDIGCYTLGILPPLKAADFLICMGSGVSSGGGFSKVQNLPVVPFIGDSTFFHAGVPGLINAVSNGHKILLVILDNGTTAMTGQQPHPGVELTPQGKIEPKVNLEKLVLGCGVKQVATINPLQVKKSQQVLREFKDKMNEAGVSVIISKSPCPLFESRMTKKQKKIVFRTDESKSCADCKKCLKELACPAFFVETSNGVEHVLIDESLCRGCSVCSQICDSISPKRIS